MNSSPGRFGSVATAAAAERLDQALARAGLAASRRQARKLLDDRRIVVNGAVVAVASRAIRRGERLAVIAKEAVLSILFVDHQIIVVDKPAGVPSQPSREVAIPSIVEIAAVSLDDLLAGDSLHLVHRLDTNTSGALLFARQASVAAALSEQVRSREITRHYLALVRGRVGETIEIDRPIARQSASRFEVRADGRPARTIVRPLAVSDDHSLVEAILLTGRTHQIRVHLTDAGHPIVGDRKYGGADPAAPRMMLHAHQLAVPGYPGWTAPLPEDFRLCAEVLGLELRVP
jgi:23S rRNA pseudouridine1911/1915/1917 synthase